MKKIIKKVISVMLGLIMSLPGVCSAVSTADNYDKVEVWCRKDIVLLSEKKYDNPYEDVDIDAVFTHEDGTQINLYGFWNGGDEWRVRFAPTKTGRWDYVITCTDKDNADLNSSGSLTAIKNTGETDLDKHGFVKISDNNRFFVYDDGTPFYWLGDTNWQAPNYVSVTECNYPGCSCGNQFMHEVNNRVDKGFTVYQTYFDSGESDGGGQLKVTKEPSMWTKKYNMINPQTFSDKFDLMFDYLSYKGMVIALGFGVHTNTVNSMGKDTLIRLSRYLTARYAAYPVIWITAQEITGEEQFDAWVSSARTVDQGDGYGHPQSAHQYPLESNDEFVKKLDNEDWHDFYTLQNGHGPALPKKSTYKGYYNSKTAKPFVESEANYEDIYCGGFNGYSASRIAAWKANLCGSCGFTYGVTGIWANCRSTSGSTGWLGSYSTEPWYMGLDKPGSYEMKYMADFFRYVDFSTLIPRFDSKKYSDFKNETKVLASSDDNKTYVAYLYNSDRSAGTLYGLNSGETYSAKWYDPLTGKFIPVSDGTVIQNGSYEIPEKPTGDDWVFLLTSKDLSCGFETEAMPEAPVNANINVLAGAKATASSFSTSSSSPDKATDGNDDTWWCAANGEFPQYITFNSDPAFEFNSYELKMYQGTALMKYSIQISDDGKDFSTIYKAEDDPPAKAGTIPVFSGTLDKTYSAKYIRFYFEKIKGNWAAVVDAAAYIKNSDKTEVRKFNGELQSPGVSCVGGYIYKTDDAATDTAKNVTDKDLNTVFSPFAPESTQTFIFDLYEEKEVYGINVIFGKKSTSPGCLIEGSSDCESWYVLSNTILTGTEICIDGENPVISEALSGKYRYIKLVIGGAPDKNSKKTVAEIEIYADGKTNKQESKANIKPLLKTYNEYKSVNNKNGQYYAPRYRDLVLSLGDCAKLLADPSKTNDEEINAVKDKIIKCAEQLKTAPEETPETETAETEAAAADTAKTDDTTEGEGDNKGKPFPVIPVIAAAAAVAAGVIAAVIVIKKRKRK